MSLKHSDSELETGDYAPEFELEDYRGQKVALSDLDNYDGVFSSIYVQPLSLCQNPARGAEKTRQRVQLNSNSWNKS